MAELSPALPSQRASGVFLVLHPSRYRSDGRPSALLVECKPAGSFEEFESILGDVERFPDLIITDFRLRDAKTAREVAMLGAARLGRPCPCLVVTGEPAASIVPLACEQDVLSKPVSPAELRRGMLALIGGVCNETA